MQHQYSKGVKTGTSTMTILALGCFTKFYSDYFEICVWWGNIFILCVPFVKAGWWSWSGCLAHLRGWWMCWLRCWLGGSLGIPGWGFWWATWAAAGVKSLSPFVTTPDTITGTFGGLLLTYSSSSSSFCSGSGAAAAAAVWCFCTILIPPAFTAGRCPPLVSTFSFGGDDMSSLIWSLQQ